MNNNQAKLAVFIGCAMSTRTGTGTLRSSLTFMSIGHFGFAVEPYRLQPNDSDPLGLQVYMRDKELVWLISFNPDL